MVLGQQEPFIGRETLLAEVSRSRPAVMLLVGDSGVGKSELLRKAQAVTADALVSEPVEVFASDGALQAALLDAISSAFCSLMADEAWRAHRATGLAFMQRLLARSASEARRAVGSAVVSQLRKRLGGEVVDIAIETWDEATGAVDESFSVRAAALRDPSVVHDLAALAEELRAMSGREHLVLAIDRLEILPESSIRILADLARVLPDGVLVRGALMNGSAEGLRLLDTVLAVGGAEVVVVEVPPLDEDATRFYLASAGVDPALAATVLRLTGGYPLHLGDAALHLKNGGRVYDLPINRHFGSVIHQSWSTLSSPVRTLARQVCLLERPLPLPTMLDAVGISESEWWDASERLRRARIFTQVVDGLPWFHEQRRRWLLGQLADDEPRAYAARLLPRVAALLVTPAGWRYATTLAELVHKAGDEVVDDALRSLRHISNGSLAVAGALLELSEPAERIVDAQSLLDHARSHFGVSEDLVLALADLEQRGLARVHSSESAAVAYATFSLSAAAAVAGLCQLRLGRMPLPSLASAVWRNFLRPLAQPLGTAVIGVGSPLPGRLVSDLYKAEMRLTGNFGDGFAGCVAYGSHRSTPIYAAAKTTVVDETRLAEAWRKASGEIADGSFSVTDVLSFPGTRVASRRWVVAANDLLGRQQPTVQDPQIRFEVAVNMQAAVRESARRRMKRSERIAGGWTESAHYFFLLEPLHRMVIEVTGLEPGATQVDIPKGPLWTLNDPYFRLRLAQLLHLPAHAHIRRMSGSGGRGMSNPHPLREFGEDAHRLLLEFNRERRPIQVALVPGEVEAWLTTHLYRRYRDAAELYAGVDSSSLREPHHWEVFILTWPAAGSSMMEGVPAATALRPAGRPIVHYEVATEAAEGFGFEEILRRFPEVDRLEITGHADLSHAIAAIAGFDDTDVFSTPV